jgi:hypothetical protein
VKKPPIWGHLKLTTHMARLKKIIKLALGLNLEVDELYGNIKYLLGN